MRVSGDALGREDGRRHALARAGRTGTVSYLQSPRLMPDIRFCV